MARVLGLDLGSFTVKGVVLDTSARGAVVRAHAQVPRHEGDRNETLAAAVKALLAQEAMKAEQVVVALPGISLATHQLSLPFSDPKRIDATLPFEVEGQLPFDLDEAVFDYQIANRTEKKTDLLVSVVRKDDLRGLLELLASVGVEPRIVTHPGIAYHALLSGTLLGTPAEAAATEAGAGEAVAVLDLGHERTTVAFGRPGSGVEFARTFAGGGKDLTRSLAKEFQIATPDAQAWKDQHGALASHVNGPDAERAAAAFMRALQPILRELRASTKAYSAKSRRQINRVWLCGGTGQIPGLDEYLQQELSIPTQRLLLPADSQAPLVKGQELAAVQPYALGLRAAASGARASRFNLRRGEFAFKGDFDYVRDRIPVLVGLAAAVLVMLIATGIVRNTMLARREAQVDQVLCDVTQRVLGSCEKNYDRALNMLRGKESPAADIPKLSAQTLLTELVDRIPSDVTVTFDQIVVDSERVSLRGETDSSKTVDKITTALKSYRCFHDVKQGKLEKTKGGNKLNFNLDIQVECPEQGAAPTQG